MGKLRHILWMTLSLVIVQARAQQSPCGTDDATRTFSATHAHAVNSFKTAESNAMSLRDNAGGRNHDALVSIPCVVHVVWNTALQNISDEQVFSQIEVLNEDYRRLCADTTAIRAVFKPFAGDARLQFCLARRDPGGSPTNGITRTYTAVTSFGCDDQVKFDTLGGKNGWDPSRYLNIWVCNLNCANGYAYYPGIPPQYDGVVIHYYVFGRTGYVAPGYKGRTTCHETGHWLGLYHPFYYEDDPCEGNTLQSCASMGDKVCDTPKDSTPAWECIFRNTCIDIPADLPDMYENIMDYTDDGCRVMFTYGQISRMNSFLYTARLSLLVSTGCIPPGTNYLNAVLAEISYPLKEICKTTFSPEVKIGNGSTVNLTQFDVVTVLDGTILNIHAWNGNLASGQFAQVFLPFVNTQPGDHSLMIYTRMPNGMPDQYPFNDTCRLEFHVMAEDEGLIPDHAEGFEGTLFPPEGWVVENPDGDIPVWRKRVGIGGFGNSSSSVYFPNSYCWPDDTKDYLLTPWFNLTSCANVFLSFDYAYSEPDPAYLPLFSDTLAVYYSVNCTQNWIKFWEKGGTTLATAPPVIPFAPFIPLPGNWQRDTIDLSAIAGDALVQFRFENRSGFGNDLFLDNINISAPLAIKAHEYPVVQIFPIPPGPDGLLFIRLENPSGACAEIYDVSGRKVYTSDPGELSDSIDLSFLQKGIYLIRILLRGEVPVTGRILKLD